MSKDFRPQETRFMSGPINYGNAVEKEFRKLFGEQPVIFRSPGRVNLIGEHTDYNLGYVLPGAIDRSIYFGLAPRRDKVVCLYALDMGESYVFNLVDIRKTDKSWPNYLIGVVDQLQKAGYNFTGFNCLFGGDIPIGAGLSSSAAIEAGLAFALDNIFELNIDKLDLVKLAQKAENEFVGVQCGIMDQFINIFGEHKKVLRLDCRSLEFEYFPFQFNDVAILLFNSNISHSLASSEYNKRRLECSEGVRLIRQKFPNIQTLRDVTLEMLSEVSLTLDKRIFHRCKYVVEENERLLRACASLSENDPKAFGETMYGSHEGLRFDYEVSCQELDFLVSLAKGLPGVYGSRMTGGGFGGCTINLVLKDAVPEICKFVKERYSSQFNHDPDVYVTALSEGTSVVAEDANIRL